MDIDRAATSLLDGCKMASVFLSHSHADKVIARRLARDLRAAGVTVWIDEAELGIGDSLIHNIGKAIDTTDFLGVLLSNDSVQSDWVLREVEVALTQEFAGRTVKVLPLLVDNCNIPAFLRGKVYADFRDAAMYQQELARVLDRLGANSATSSTTIMFDESYKQDQWYAQPVVSAGFSTVAGVVADDYNVISNDQGYSSADILSPKCILILPMPFGSIVDERHYANIAKWVNRGGRLVLLGFYLMETHHYSNLNNLARRFGFEFSPNLTMPKGREDFRQCMDQAFAYANRNYWIETMPNAMPASHPLIEGIATLAITSSCTVDSATTPDLLVSTSYPVAVLHARGHKNPEGRLVQLTDYVLDKHDSAPILVALRYGGGQVVGIGSWKVFVNELVEDSRNDNLRLFQNLISWLAQDSSVSQNVTPTSP